MNYADIFHADSFVWVLVALLLGLFVLRRIEDGMKPVLGSIVDGVAKNAASNAAAYAIAIMFGLSASLSAFYDVFSQLDDKAFTGLTLHQYAALWAKVLNPFLVAVLAYATQNKFRGGSPVAGAPGSASTTSPFPSTQKEP